MFAASLIFYVTLSHSLDLFGSPRTSKWNSEKITVKTVWDGYCRDGWRCGAWFNCDQHASACLVTALELEPPLSFSSVTGFILYPYFPLGSCCLWMCLSLHVFQSAQRHTPEPSSQVKGRNTHKHAVVHKQEPHITQYLLFTLQWNVSRWYNY